MSEIVQAVLASSLLGGIVASLITHFLTRKKHINEARYQRKIDGYVRVTNILSNIYTETNFNNAIQARENLKKELLVIRLFVSNACYTYLYDFAYNQRDHDFRRKVFLDKFYKLAEKDIKSNSL